MVIWNMRGSDLEIAIMEKAPFILKNRVKNLLEISKKELPKVKGLSIIKMAKFNILVGENVENIMVMGPTFSKTVMSTMVSG